MTGAHRLSGPTTLFAQLGRWLTLAALAVAGAFMVFFSAAFALFLLGGIALVTLIAVAVFWVRAKLTGRPFGPRAHMEELRRQMNDQMGDMGFESAARRSSPNHGSDGPVIDAHETAEGWTVER